MFRRIRNYFITGILVLLPSVATIYIIWWLFSSVDDVLRPLTKLIVGREIYGLGLLATGIVIFLVGLFATNVLGKKLIETGELILARIPVVRNIYLTVKQVIDALFLTNKTAFKKVVMVEYPRKGIYQIGFVTNMGRGEVQIKTKEEVTCVFIPTTPNPTSGMLVFVPEKDLVYLNMTIEGAMKLVISGGIIFPPYPGENGEEDIEDIQEMAN